MSDQRGDEWTERLALLFLKHPAWVAAAGNLETEATSTVYFTHRPGEPWRLETQDGETLLLPGAAEAPDLVFRFSPDAIARLESIEGGIGDFAVVLFEQIIDQEVDLRIRADFSRLIRRGYVRLLLAAGLPVLAFGARHGVRTLGALRRFVTNLRARGVAEWECD